MERDDANRVTSVRTLTSCSVVHRLRCLPGQQREASSHQMRIQLRDTHSIVWVFPQLLSLVWFYSSCDFILISLSLQPNLSHLSSLGSRTEKHCVMAPCRGPVREAQSFWPWHSSNTWKGNWVSCETQDSSFSDCFSFMSCTQLWLIQVPSFSLALFIPLLFLQKMLLRVTLYWTGQTSTQSFTSGISVYWTKAWRRMLKRNSTLAQNWE